MSNQNALTVVSKTSPVGSKQSMAEKVSDLLIEVNTATAYLSRFTTQVVSERNDIKKVSEQLSNLHTTLVEAFAIISDTPPNWLNKSVSE